MTKTEMALCAIEAELAFARNKFPSATLSFVALVEEVGELARALLKKAAATTPEDRQHWHEEVWNEGMQVGAMAIRVMTEFDPSFNVHYVDPT